MHIEQIIDGILRRESSEYTNRAADAGGPTKYGITQKTLAEWRGQAVTEEDVRNLTEEEARKIYYHRYVRKHGFDRILPVAPEVAEEVIDTGVNMGQALAARWLQQCLNVFNYRQKFYADIVVDGRVGENTVAALTAYLKKRGAEGQMILLRALNCLQGARYIELASERESDEENIYGWLRTRV